MKTKDIKKRLEYLRGEIEKECISYGEIAELQSLAGYIDPDDILLLQWAGVPEEDVKEYDVLFWYTEGGTIQVRANSPEQAKKFAEMKLEEEGIVKMTIDTAHREWQVLEVNGKII